MECVELNPVGNFDPWDPEKMHELKNNISESIGQHLLFENKWIRLWDIFLKPGQRLPFRLQNRSYSWTSLTEGLAISRYSNGKISLLRFRKGDNAYQEFTGSFVISDFENIGEEPLKINILEYKQHPIEQQPYW